MQYRNVSGIVKRLLSLCEPAKRKDFIWLTLWGFLSAIAELLTVGAVIPLLFAASNPTNIANAPVVGPYIENIFHWFNLPVVIIAALLLSIIALIATFIRMIQTWMIQRFVFGVHEDMIISIYEGILGKEYEWFISGNNSSFVISTIEKTYSLVINCLSALAAAIPSAIMILLIVVAFALVDPAIALLSLGIVGVMYFLLARIALYLARGMSDAASELRNTRVKSAQELLGGIRDVILDGSQNYYQVRAEKEELQFKKIHVKAGLINGLPRILVDGTLIILIAVLTVFLANRPGGFIQSLPLLGAMAVGGQRLMPLIQQLYAAYINLTIYSAYLDDIEMLATRETSGARPLVHVVDHTFKRIELRNVSLRYPNGRSALSNVNLEISRAERIGIVGKTGSGKSSLLDVIMGILRPTQGTMVLNSTPSREASLRIRNLVAHVPQNIFLADDTIAANIALARPNDPIDFSSIDNAVRQAGLSEFISDLPNGVMTGVGERGIQLSGGQLQRIGIARALYKGSPILILDEATSALDAQTEDDVLSEVFSADADLTIILVTHRLAALARCDRILNVQSGRITEQQLSG